MCWTYVRRTLIALFTVTLAAGTGIQPASADNIWFEQSYRYIGSASNDWPYGTAGFYFFDGTGANGSLTPSIARGDFGGAAAVSSSVGTIFGKPNSYITIDSDGEIVLHPDQQEIAGFSCSFTNGTIVNVVDPGYIGRGIAQENDVDTTWVVCSDGDQDATVDIDVHLEISWSSSLPSGPWARGDNRDFEMRIDGLGIGVDIDSYGNLVGSGPGMSASVSGFPHGNGPGNLATFVLDGTVAVPVGTEITAVGMLDKDPATNEPQWPFAFVRSHPYWGPTYSTTATDGETFTCVLTMSVATP